MKNIGLTKLEKASVDNFTTSIGIKVRRIINRPIRSILKLFTNGKITVDKYPKLEKGKQYIFASTHACVEEISATLSTIDRSAYTLCGTTDQFEHNPKMYANWATGVIYVNRMDEESRKESLLKQKRILNEGSSILLFPEGGLNNNENLLIQRLFNGAYILSRDTNIEVVPMATFNELGSKNIYVSVSEPIKLYEYDKEEANIILRDALATLTYEHIFNHGTKLKRSELPSDPRMWYMEERRNEYLRTKWTRDVWDEELTIKRDKMNPYPNEVRKTFENVRVTKDNAYVMAPILSRLDEDNKYDFNRYMHENWDKPKTKSKKRI